MVVLVSLIVKFFWAVALADLKTGANVAIEAKKEGEKLIASTIIMSILKAEPVKK